MRIIARAIGPDIEHPHGRQRIDILDAAHEITLTGNRQYGLRPRLIDDLPGECPACRYEEMEAHLLRKRHQRTDVTTAAAFAVIRIPRDLMRAGRKLQAVRRHHEQSFSRYPDAQSAEQQVADRNERSFQPPFADAEWPPQLHRQRKQQIDELIGLTPQERQIAQSRHGQGHIDEAQRRSSCQDGKDAADHSRQHRSNLRESGAGNIPDAIEQC